MKKIFIDLAGWCSRGRIGGCNVWIGASFLRSINLSGDQKTLIIVTDFGLLSQDASLAVSILEAVINAIYTCVTIQSKEDFLKS